MDMKQCYQAKSKKKDYPNDAAADIGLIVHFRSLFKGADVTSDGNIFVLTADIGRADIIFRLPLIDCEVLSKSPSRKLLEFVN